VTRGRLAGWPGGAALVLLCLAAHWPGSFALPPVDRDESRFAQASWQMLESARAGEPEGMVVPQVQERARLNKPPMVYWLQAASAAAGGDDGSLGARSPATGGVGRYRVPSLLSAMAATLLTWRVGLALRLAPAAAWLGAALLGTCLMVLWDARQARADQLLLATTTGSMLQLAHLWRRRDEPVRATRWRALGLHVWIGLGVLAKGPVAPMVAVLAAAALCVARRDARLLRHARPLTGVVVATLIVAPWVVAVGQAVGWGTYWSIVWDETIGRAGAAKESHWGPPGYHLVLLAIVFFPGSLATARGFVAAWRRCLPRRAGSGWWGAVRSAGGVWRGRDAEPFLIAWIVPAWIVFELMATKLPHYTLPLYPAVALLSARWLLRLEARRAGVDRPGGIVFLLIGAAMMVGVPLGLWWTGGDRGVADLALVAALMVGMGASGIWLWRGRWVAAQAAAMVVSVASLAAMSGTLLPGHRSLWVSSRVAAILEREDPAGERPIAAVGYQEDSLIFLTRGRAERVGRKRLAAWLADHPGGLVAATAPVEAAALGLRVIDGVEGLNYSNGERVEVVVYERRGRPGPGEGPGSTRGGRGL
jgi:4-amino-4-deoxy-L-arabinose transferase-like glycosyltransferase